MNVNEYGVIFAFSCGFDMSADTSVQLQFWKPDNPWTDETNLTPSLTKSSPSVTVGSVPLLTTLGTFAANQYLKYTFVGGDVDQEGTWSVRAVYNDTLQHLISDVAEFVVYP